MNLFSQLDQKELQTRLTNLRRVCYPSIKLAIPQFKFKRKKDFQLTDTLSYGLDYDISPAQLKDLWEDRETLHDHNIDYIIVKGEKWFYNIPPEILDNNNEVFLFEDGISKDPFIIGEFYSKDGQKKVEVELPFWMTTGKLWKQPDILNAMKKVLEKCSGNTFPTQEEAAACFSTKILRKIHNQNPSREAVEMAVLEMMETLRKKIADYLEKNHFQDILKEPGFLMFTQQKNKQPNKPDTQKVKEYLAGDKQAMYFLAQKFGLIHNASRIIPYEKMRDHVRHPNQVKALPLFPQTIYRDFEKALGITQKKAARAQTLKAFDENTDIVQHLTNMSEIWDILDFHVEPKLRKKRGSPAYYQDLIQKGLLTLKDVKIIRNRKSTTNEVAHLNHRIKRARQKVMKDKKLLGLAISLEEKHQEKINRWIKENSHTI